MFKQDSECGMVGKGTREFAHRMYYMPGKVKLGGVSENVEHVVVGTGGELEAVFGVEPGKEFESALPVIAVRKKSSANSGGIRVYGLWGGN